MDWLAFAVVKMFVTKTKSVYADGMDEKVIVDADPLPVCVPIGSYVFGIISPQSRTKQNGNTVGSLMHLTKLN